MKNKSEGIIYGYEYFFTKVAYIGSLITISGALYFKLSYINCDMIPFLVLIILSILLFIFWILNEKIDEELLKLRRKEDEEI